jgi:pilus assembly protein CpaB
MTKRILIALGLAILVGTFASVYVYRQVQRAAARPEPVRTMQVVVAAMPMPLGTRLAPQHLRLVDWPANRPAQGMFHSTDEVVNRAVLTSVVENEPIMAGKLAPVASGAGLPATIPEGKRAISVAVNDVVAVAGFVGPGTMVDVLVTGSVSGRGGDNSMTRTILENVPVLAAGQKIEQDQDGKPQSVPVITLLVTPDEANKLTMASSEGRIQLALRNTIDTEIQNTSPILRTSIFGVSGPPRRLAPGPRQESFVVEVIRGNKRESSTF